MEKIDAPDALRPRGGLEKPKLTFHPRAIENELSTNLPASVTNPPSTGSNVDISITQLDAAKMTNDQSPIPIRIPNGPALVSGPPIETKRAAPIAPLIAMSWTCLMRRPLSVSQCARVWVQM
jgi:hypothetical protein